jgi:hypothetical protein
MRSFRSLEHLEGLYSYAQKYLAPVTFCLPARRRGSSSHRGLVETSYRPGAGFASAFD